MKGIVFMKTVGNQPPEWKLVSLRECPTPEEMQTCDGPPRRGLGVGIGVIAVRSHIPCGGQAGSGWSFTPTC